MMVPRTDSQKYYAVARGGVPGIYEAWDGEWGARKQTDGFSGALYKRFSCLSSAIEFMCDGGVPENEILYFKAHFSERLNFKPYPFASFNDKYKRLVSTQNNTKPQVRAEKVDAIRNELIPYYLPGGVPIDQVDDDGKIRQSAICNDYMGEVTFRLCWLAVLELDFIFFS
jgi:hypothetical protein